MAEQEDSDLISVIIPIYNSVDYLKEAVQSVIAQTYLNWEIILVNDGSTQIVVQYAIGDVMKLNSKIRQVTKLNGGLADARNAGIMEATGKYILPLDSDDMLEPTYMAKVHCMYKRDLTSSRQ